MGVIFFYNFFFFASVTFHIACEQQTHFRSSLLSPRKIAFFNLEGEKRRPEMRLLFAGYMKCNAGEKKIKRKYQPFHDPNIFVLILKCKNA